VASSYKNGSVSIWDVRNPSKPFYNYKAHLESVMSVDWHPLQRDVILSSGQDNYIKIWNINQ